MLQTCLKELVVFCQDALTDLTGDSERLPVEEQHGTWLGHKVREDCLEVFLYHLFKHHRPPKVISVDGLEYL